MPKTRVTIKTTAGPYGLTSRAIANIDHERTARAAVPDDMVALGSKTKTNPVEEPKTALGVLIRFLQQHELPKDTTYDHLFTKEIVFKRSPLPFLKGDFTKEDWEDWEDWKK